MESQERIMSADDKTGPAGSNSAWPVMVLAHNEERHIAACLDSIFASDPGCTFEVFVMANGCSDRTEQIVADYAARRPEVRLVSIALGDKCNAWNVFIHETVPAHCPDRDVYFFMDGDARAVRGSFSAMARALQDDPHANAASAIPASGRNIERDRNAAFREHGLVANLYSLRGTFVQRLRERSIRIPLRLEGDDGLIGALVKWDLKPESNGFDPRRIVVCGDAAFEFESIVPTRPQDWPIYWKRAVRYGRRHYEFKLLGSLLKGNGLPAMPADITELYSEADKLPLRKQGLYTVTNWVALRQMVNIGRDRQES